MPLSDDAKGRAAAILVEARRSGSLLQGLPVEVCPSTLDEGYAIQDLVCALWDDKVAGWKTGATAAAVQLRLGTDRPLAGAFFSRTVHQSPARLPAKAFHHKAVESEFGFRFSSGLAARAATYSRDEVLAAIDALVPAVEIVGPRFTDLLFGRMPTAVADNTLNAAFVFGQPVTAWRDIDLPAHKVHLAVNDVIVAEGRGADVLGDPITSLVWTVNHLSARGIAVEPGQIFSTGTTTGIVTLKPGDMAVADFGRLGQVSVTFTE
jgi:2-keto-4-pentenoate hydratase